MHVRCTRGFVFDYSPCSVEVVLSCNDKGLVSGDFVSTTEFVPKQMVQNRGWSGSGGKWWRRW